MEFQFYGANCIRINTKRASFVVDDNLNDLGGKSVAKPQDVLLLTAFKPEQVPQAKMVIDGPGEYEVSDISVQGIAARAHMDEEGKKTATVYRIVAEDIRVVVTGHIYPDLNDDQLEALGLVDVMFVPVGGHGFTLDPVGALKIIKKVEPKIVIPTYYDDKNLNYPVPALSLESALKELGMEPSERLAKFRIKSSELSDVTRLVVLEP